MGDRHTRKRKRQDQSEICINCSQRYDTVLAATEGRSWPMYPLRCDIGQPAGLDENKSVDMSSCSLLQQPSLFTPPLHWQGRHQVAPLVLVCRCDEKATEALQFSFAQHGNSLVFKRDSACRAGEAAAAQQHFRSMCDDLAAQNAVLRSQVVPLRRRYAVSGHPFRPSCMPCGRRCSPRSLCPALAGHLTAPREGALHRCSIRISRGWRRYRAPSLALRRSNKAGRF